MDITFSTNQKKLTNLIDLLHYLNDSYQPHLDKQVNIDEYSKKLLKYANFIFINYNTKTIGLIAYYISNNESFITSIGIHKEYHGKKLGKALFDEYLKRVKEDNINFIKLHVNKKNKKAQKFYLQNGFQFEKYDDNTILAIKELKKY